MLHPGIVESFRTPWAMRRWDQNDVDRRGIIRPHSMPLFLGQPLTNREPQTLNPNLYVQRLYVPVYRVHAALEAASEEFFQARLCNYIVCT